MTFNWTDNCGVIKYFNSITVANWKQSHHKKFMSGFEIKKNTL